MRNVQGLLDSSVEAVMHRDFIVLPLGLTVGEALQAIRQPELEDKIAYFYVGDDQGRLKGVLPTRRLLTASLGQPITGIMNTGIVSVPRTMTVMDACEMFVMHKFLAFPVVDEEQRILGVVDVGQVTSEVFDFAERRHISEVFETIGFYISQVRGASVLTAFRYRFPWLLTSITSGILCALLARSFELTIAKSLVLTFFLTLMLGLGESVTIQSMTLTIQGLRSVQPTLMWYMHAFRREAGTALMLGLACGSFVGLIVLVWFGSILMAFIIGSSIVLALISACFFGLSVPSLLHALKLDPKIAAGPVTLALTDIFTLLAYFGMAAFLL